MNSVISAASAPVQASPRAPESAARRWFYSVATVLLLVLTLVGFQLFYFRGMAYPGRPLTPPIKSLIIVHGIAMMLWMLLAIAQPLLVAGANRRLHMALGRVGAVLAAGLLYLGIKLGVAACQVAPAGMMFGPLTPRQFMAIPVTTAVLFALFVAAGVLWRKRPEAHRPMMFLASLAAVSAAIARIDALNHLYAGSLGDKLFGVFFFVVVIGAVFLAAKCLVFRKFDRCFAGGWAAMSLWFLVAWQAAPTPAWDAVASLLLR